MRHLTGKKRLWLAPVFLVGLTLLVFATMHLWNLLMPGILHLPQISFWQAAGLLILSRLLFGFGGHWGRHHRAGHLREKWAQMTPEEREEFSKHLREHRHGWGGFRNFGHGNEGNINS